MSLFQGIEQFRGQLGALNIQVVFRKDGQLHVSVTPVVEEKAVDANPHLTKPFAFTATAAELDAEFVSALAPVASTRASLVEQAKQEAEQMKAAAASKKTTTAKAASTKVAPQRASGAVSFDDETDTEGEGDDAKDTPSTASAPSPAPVAAPAAPADTSADKLF